MRIFICSSFIYPAFQTEDKRKNGWTEEAHHQNWRVNNQEVPQHVRNLIATGGKQYKVSEGDVIRVEKLGVEAGETYNFDQVLAVGGDTLTVGTPTVAGATVTASVIGDGKGKKVIVYKYKRKSGYHKKNGHRQQYTAVKIEKISVQ